MGRRRRSAAEWQQLVEQWLGCGQSREQFAHANGLNPATLGWWRWKLRQRERQEFLTIDVVDVAPVHPPDLVVEVGQLRVRVPSGFDAGELRRLVQALC